MSDSMKSIIFAAALCLVCSALLTAAATGLQGFQQQNVQIDRQKNILKAVGLASDTEGLSKNDIQERYRMNIRQLWVDTTGMLKKKVERTATDMPLYVYMKDKKIESYVIPINSRGLWGKIYGYLAIDNDGETVTGFTVYKHQETPGLGGEIEKSWFQKNFVNKKIVGRDGDFVSISVAKGKVIASVKEEKHPNYVDGISGATMTGKFLTEGLREVLTTYEPVSIRFRKNRMAPVTLGE